MPFNFSIRNGSILFSLLLFSLVSCKKNHSSPSLPKLPASTGTAVQLSVDLSQPGAAIPNNFLGLSYEMTAITNSNYFTTSNASFIQLIKNLGNNNILRIGANGVDKTYWCGHARYTTSGNDSICTTDIDRFKSFVQATGWNVIFGLNLGGNPNVAVAKNEAGYIASSLGNNLYSLEVGNEPDIYPSNGFRTQLYNIDSLENEWNNYYQAIHASYPGLNFSGPAVAYRQDWLSSFAMTEGSKINLLTIHYYQGGPGTDPSINLGTLLSPHADSLITKFANTTAATAVKSNLPFRIAECNSIYGGGKSGVSNTFGASLWAIDYMWKLAYSGCTGFNFHGGGNGPYTPIAEVNGVFSANPEYYSMLFFKDGSKGNLLPVTLNSAGLNVSAYACKGLDQNIYVSIVNKEYSSPISVNIQTGGTTSSVTLESLSASSLTATSGISLAGKTINGDGSITPTSLPAYTVQSKAFSVNIPAASAMLLIIHP